jgi:serine/threonine protein kinase
LDPNSPRWTEISPSEFAWEREALTFVREGLPDHDPYRAWSNFEFIGDDGSINEVDLLVLTPKGFYLVEIKSRPGRVEGDAGTWSWRQSGRGFTDDNPLILANRKAKKLIGLLRRQKSMGKVRNLFLKAHIFLSDETNTFHLPASFEASVDVRDREADDSHAARSGIIAALTRFGPSDAPRHRMDKPIAKAVTRAMEEAGIRPSRRARKIQDYELEELLFEGPSYQDWVGKHVSLKNELARVRIYSIEPGASQDLRETIANAARRERTILRGIDHDGILKSTNYTDSDRGPALFFEHFKDARRLDHYLIESGEKLGVDERLGFLRQIAETVQYAHDQRLVHRALSPQSIMVIDPESKAPRLKILNWQTGARELSETHATSFGVSATMHVDELIEDASAVYMAPEALAERGSSGHELDVFSLGAIAYHLFSGQPPAASRGELANKLREDKGLQISSVLDGAIESLEFLIKSSTHPEVTARLDSAEDFLECLDDVEEELTAPDPGEALPAPTEAKPKDQIDHGYTVLRRLGKGGTALALLVEKDGQERVLKIALEPSQNDHLRAEAKVLRKLRHQYIVEIHDELMFDDRVGLVIARAGNKTLAQRLREEGRLGLELLERFGEDLLQTVDWLVADLHR